MKICTSCTETKSFNDFHKRTRAKDGYQSVCKDCNRSQRKAYYRTAHGRSIDLANGLRSQDRLKRKVYDFLSTQSCIDCGEADPVVLEFDHRDAATKVSNVSDMVRRGMAWRTIQAEIDKCDIRCSNCHKRRTAIQCGWYPWLARVV